MVTFEELKLTLWSMTGHLTHKDAISRWAKDKYEHYKNDIVAVAALVTVLNHRCWYWYENNDEELTNIYADLYYEYNGKAWDWLEVNGTADEKHWYFETMD